MSAFSVPKAKEKVKIWMWLVRRDELVINSPAPKEQQTTVTGVGCYHELWVSCRTNDCRLRDGGQMRSCCFMDRGNMMLLLLVLQCNNWRKRLSFGLQQGGRLRRCLLFLLLLLQEALYQLMLHRNTTHPSMRKTQFKMVYSSLTSASTFDSILFYHFQVTF